jgi:hypothetical protein
LERIYFFAGKHPCKLFSNWKTTDLDVGWQTGKVHIKFQRINEKHGEVPEKIVKGLRQKDADEGYLMS